MEVQPALILPQELEVTGIEVTEEMLTISTISTQTSPCCPLCGSSATQVHSRYTRTLADLPCAGVV